MVGQRVRERCGSTWPTFEILFATKRYVWPCPERERGSAVMTTNTHRLLVGHLARSDGQEDLCFTLWRPVVGKRRVSAVVDGVVLPEPGERYLHGNVSFEDAYFLRAAALAASRDCGLALVHSHPGGVSWQGLSPDDFAAEAGHAARAEVLTGLPFLGLTLATGDDSWSCRFWRRDSKRSIEPWWCENLRVVGDRYAASFNPALRPIPDENPETTRTVSAWGTGIHADSCAYEPVSLGSAVSATLSAKDSHEPALATSSGLTSTMSNARTLTVLRTRFGGTSRYNARRPIPLFEEFAAPPPTRTRPCGPSNMAS